MNKIITIIMLLLLLFRWASQLAQWQKMCLIVQETQFDPWVQKISLEEGMATYSSNLAWRIPWTEEPGGLQSMGLQRAEHN